MTLEITGATRSVRVIAKWTRLQRPRVLLLVPSGSIATICNITTSNRSKNKTALVSLWMATGRMPDFLFWDRMPTAPMSGTYLAAPVAFDIRGPARLYGKCAQTRAEITIFGYLTKEAP